MRRYFQGGLAAAVVAAAGCSQSNIAPVAGRVTLDGKPLAGAVVNFQPNDASKAYPGPGSMATTREDGGYVLQVVGKKESGAAICKHKVHITKSIGGGAEEERPEKQTIPSKYNDKTELTFEVPPGGSDKADFDLKSK